MPVTSNNRNVQAWNGSSTAKDRHIRHLQGLYFIDPSYADQMWWIPENISGERLPVSVSVCSYVGDYADYLGIPTVFTWVYVLSLSGIDREFRSGAALVFHEAIEPAADLTNPTVDFLIYFASLQIERLPSDQRELGTRVLDLYSKRHADEQLLSEEECKQVRDLLFEAKSRTTENESIYDALSTLSILADYAAMPHTHYTVRESEEQRVFDEMMIDLGDVILNWVEDKSEGSLRALKLLAKLTKLTRNAPITTIKNRPSITCFEP